MTFDDRRQVDAHPGAAIELAMHPHVAAALLHDAVDGRKPEARAFADRFRGEERLERARDRRGVHAGAGVDDFERDEAARPHVGIHPGVRVGQRLVARRDGDRAALRHRIAAVHHEIQDHLI